MNMPFFIEGDKPECARCGKPPGPNDDEWQWQLVPSVIPELSEIYYTRDYSDWTDSDWELLDLQIRSSWCWVCEGCLTLEEWMSNQCISGTE
jgi:hypothetical protein